MRVGGRRRPGKACCGAVDEIMMPSPTSPCLVGGAPKLLAGGAYECRGWRGLRTGMGECCGVPVGESTDPEDTSELGGGASLRLPWNW